MRANRPTRSHEGPIRYWVTPEGIRAATSPEEVRP